MFKSLFVLLAGSLLFVGCSHTRIVTGNNLGGSDTAFFCGAEPGLSWKAMGKETSVAVPSTELPKSFKVFTVTNASAFFERAKTGVHEVLIPLPTGCTPFKVQPSGTMSAGLQEKYPDLVSLKGDNAAGDDLRLDWNGTSFSGQVLTAAGGTTYLIAQLPGGEANTYMVYNKADSRDEKQPFEMNRAAPTGMQPMAAPPAEK